MAMMYVLQHLRMPDVTLTVQYASNLMSLLVVFAQDRKSANSLLLMNLTFF
jgi:hypothetical protein